MMALFHSTPWAWPAAALLFGLLLGSFLNVVIGRLPARLMWSWRREARLMLADDDGPEPADEPAPPDLVFSSSQCPHCAHKIRAWENVPLLGFAFLRGRCSSCKTPLSWQYPLLEAVTGLTFLGVALLHPPGAAAAMAMAFFALLIVATGVDARTQLLPDGLTYPLLWLGLLGAAAGTSGFPTAGQAIVGASIGYGLLWSVFWAFKLITGKEGMGYGDFKLLAALGAWLGAMALPWVLIGSTVAGVVFGVATMVFKGRDRQAPFAFGPFLAVAGAAVYALQRTHALALPGL